MFNVTKIAKRKVTLGRLIKYTTDDIIKEKFGKIHSREKNVNRKVHGYFVECYIRHCVGLKYNLDLKDSLIEKLPEKYNLLVKSYQKYSQKETISREELFDVSLLQLAKFRGSIFNTQGKIKYRYNSNYLTPDLEEDIKRYITRYSSGQQFNLGVGKYKLRGYIDLLYKNDLYGNEIVDFKTSTTYIGGKIEDFYQLFLYALISPKKINRLTIYNTLKNYSRSVDITEWDSEKLLKYVAELK